MLIFPDMIRYRRLTHFDVDTFVEEVLVKDNEWLPGTPETLSGSYIFVCCHGSRDRRCGVCGPALVMKFQVEIEIHGLHGQVSVRPCSHIGGHKYAGNVIIFCPNANGEVTGHWYGYVTPDDVPILLEQHIKRGEVVGHLWRGQMGLSEEDQKNSLELGLQQNHKTSVEKRAKESTLITSTTAGCCQGTEKSSCCQVPQPSEKSVASHVNESKTKTAEKKSSKVSKINGKAACTRKPCAMPTWFESWEREDTYAALAVVWAITSVAIAYRCYRQMS